GQVIVPDGIVQAERLVAVAPGIAGLGVLLDDDRRHVELAQPRPEPDRPLTAADDDDIRLPAFAERRRLLVAPLLPAFGVAVDAVQGAGRAGETLPFLVALKFDECRQQRPRALALQAQMAIAAPGLGLEGKPRLGDAVVLGDGLVVGEAKVARLHGAHAGGEHGLDGVAALGGVEVPGEGDEIAPEAFRGEKLRRALGVLRRQRGAEPVEKGLSAALGGSVEHECRPFRLLVSAHADGPIASKLSKGGRSSSALSAPCKGLAAHVSDSPGRGRLRGGMGVLWTMLVVVWP